MKIIGITYLDETCYITLKTDSSLLTNNRPFFIPDWDIEFVVQPCIIIRICRLGKNIEEKFANKYFDKMAHGLDFRAKGVLNTIRSTAGDWSTAVSFDASLCMGELFPPNNNINEHNYALTIPQAICRISRFYTIRQGDLLYIDKKEPEQKIIKNQVFKITNGQKNLLYCKIK